MLNAGKVSARIDLVYAVVQESRPVIGHHLVQVGHQLVEGIGHDQRPRIAALSEKDTNKIVQRLLIVGRFANQSVNIQPQQLALIVVVLTAPPVRPHPIFTAKNARGDRRILRGTPVAPRSVVKQSSKERQYITILLLRLEP